jgi:hypothetical protein
MIAINRNGTYFVTAPDGEVLEFTAKRDYAWVVISTKNPDRTGWKLEMATNDRSVAASKCSKIVGAARRLKLDYIEARQVKVVKQER